MEAEKDQSIEAFIGLLRRANGNPRDKLAALDVFAKRRLLLASWEPQARGFRTLVNGSGDEALAVFSSNEELRAAAAYFGWLDEQDEIVIEELEGSHIIRHAWTREYRFVVIDVASEHSLQYAREELEAAATQEVEQTGKFRTSRPPARPIKAGSTLKAPPKSPTKSPTKPPVRTQVAATQYHVVPPLTETLNAHPLTETSAASRKRPSKDPGMTVEVSVEVSLTPSQSPPRKPAASSKRPSRNAPRKKLGSPPIEEVPIDTSALGAGGTYGAARAIPKQKKSRRKAGPSPLEPGISEFETTDPGAPFLNVEQPEQNPATPKAGTEGRGAPPMPMKGDMLDEASHIGELHDDDVLDDDPTRIGELPDEDFLDDITRVAQLHDDDVLDDDPTRIGELDDDDVLDDVTHIGELGRSQAPRAPEVSDRPAQVRADDDTQPVDTAGPARRKARRLKERSIHDDIELVPLDSAPDEELLKDLGQALREYPEVDWASFCLMSEGGRTVPSIGLRIADNYRENVEAIVQAVLRASQPHALDLGVLLIDGHDLLRKARESGYVFFPWTPKTFDG